MVDRLNRPAIVLSLLSSLLLGGCVTESSETISIDPVRENSSYLFVAQDGSQLEMKIKGTELRADAHFRPHPALILEYRFHKKGEESPRIDEEAISLADGLTVQQAKLCAPWDDCVTEDILVYYGQSGLPGAFGMGPLWAKGTLTTKSLLPVHPTAYTTESLSLQLTPAEVDGEECHKIQYEPMPARLRLFQPVFNTIIQWALLCPGSQVPIEFQLAYPASLVGREPALQFRLEDADAGTQEIAWEGEEGIWELPGQAVQPSTWWDEEGPRYMHNDSDYLTFSLPEAHRELLRRHDGYRAFFEEEPTATILRTVSTLKGTYDPGPILEAVDDREETYYRTIMVGGKERPPGVYSIHKIVRDPHGSPKVSYEVVEPDQSDLERLGKARNLDMQIQADAQASPIEAMELFHSLYGEKPDVIHMNHGLAAEHSDDPLIRHNGYEVRVYKREPPDPGAMSFGVIELSIDGPTGSVLRMNYPRDQWPFDGPP